MRSSRPSMRRPPRSAEADTVVRVGILETDVPPPALQDRFGASYAPMMARMLGEGFVCEGFDVTAGQYPADPRPSTAYLITGSSAGVYDPLPWIAPLEDFLRAPGRASAGRGLLRPPDHGPGLRRQGEQVAQGLGHRPAPLSRDAREPWMDGAAPSSPSRPRTRTRWWTPPPEAPGARRQRLHALRRPGLWRPPPSRSNATRSSRPPTPRR